MQEIRLAFVGDSTQIVEGTYLRTGIVNDLGGKPTSLASLTNQGAYSYYDPTTRRGWKGPYVDSTGQNWSVDAWGNAFVYNSNAMTLTSCGPDGVCGDADDIVVNLTEKAASRYLAAATSTSSSSSSSTTSTPAGSENCSLLGVGWQTSGSTCVCATGYDSWGGNCLISCAGGTSRQADGSCSCGSGYSYFNGTCVVACTGSQTRQSDGSCQTPVNGGWSAYGSWYDKTACTVSCGGGTKTQEEDRSCTNPSPAYGGASCVGSTSSTQSVACNTQTCVCSNGATNYPSCTTCLTGYSLINGSCSPTPINGGWSAWASWYNVGSCSELCGGGIQQQEEDRTCTNPTPANGGTNCSGAASSTSSIACNTQACTCTDGATNYPTCTTCATGYSMSLTGTCQLTPINGGWTSWSSWTNVGSCSATCGGGTQSQVETRSCTNPTPAHGGTSCSGASSSTQTIACNTNACTCSNGATNYPTCTTCASGSQIVGGTCTSSSGCTSWATATLSSGTDNLISSMNTNYPLWTVTVYDDGSTGTNDVATIGNLSYTLAPTSSYLDQYLNLSYTGAYTAQKGRTSALTTYASGTETLGNDFRMSGSAKNSVTFTVKYCAAGGGSSSSTSSSASSTSSSSSSSSSSSNLTGVGISSISCSQVLGNGHCACTTINPSDRVDTCLQLGLSSSCAVQYGGTNPNQPGIICEVACLLNLNPLLYTSCVQGP